MFILLQHWLNTVNINLSRYNGSQAFYSLQNFSISYDKSQHLLDKYCLFSKYKWKKKY